MLNSGEAQYEGAAPTLIVQPGPVVNFVADSVLVKHPSYAQHRMQIEGFLLDRVPLCQPLGRIQVGDHRKEVFVELRIVCADVDTL